MDGIINVYKEPGFTSHDVVAKLRGILHMKKSVIQVRLIRMHRSSACVSWESNKIMRHDYRLGKNL